MPKESTIQHYTSSTTGNTPAAIDLALGELAINIADERIFFENINGTVLYLSQTKDLSGAFASSSKVASSVNGFTGAVQVTGSGAILQTVSGTTTTFGARLSTTSVTGVASFNNVHFTVDTTGHVKLGSAYQVTGQTVVSGGPSLLVSTSGNTVTIDNRVATSSVTGVASFSSTFFTVSTTGSVQLAAAYQATGSGIATVPLATTSLTGTASFNPNRFQVSATGNVDLLAAFQVTGQTVVSGGPSQLVSTSGNTVTIDNRVASTSVTGVAAFNATRFSVSAAGAVDLGAAYQVTGDTIVAGSFINFSQSGTTKTLNNIGVQSFNGATGAVLADAVTWSVITADQTAVINRGYFANKGTLLTLTLPTTAAVGSVLRVSGMNAGLWRIAQNASEVIHFGKTDTTVGVGGYLQSTLARDSVELICCVTDNEWNVVSSIGNITIV